MRRATQLTHSAHRSKPYFYPRSPCGERHNDSNNESTQIDFYPRSPCGERPKHKFMRVAPYSISIHALLAESDRLTTTRQPLERISIHALLAESDAPAAQTQTLGGNFYPRSPCGERLAPCQSWHGVFLFLSTLSLRRATWSVDVPGWILGISIHALLAESDGPDRQGAGTGKDFYPRSPCGERRW